MNHISAWKERARVRMHKLCIKWANADQKGNHLTIKGKQMMHISVCNACAQGRCAKRA
jgi:hypothetical protein